MRRRGWLIFRPSRVLPFMILTILSACSTAEKAEEAASEALAALEAEYSEATEALSESQDSFPSMSEQPDSAERAAFRKLVEAQSEEYMALRESFVPRYASLAEEHWGTGAGLEAKIWVMSWESMPDRDEKDPEATEEERAAKIAEHTDAIFAEYAESPHMEKLAASSYFFSDEQSEEYLGRLRQESPHANVRAAAIYYPVSRKISQLRFASFVAERRVEIEIETPEVDDPYNDPYEDEDPAEDEVPAEEVDPRAEIDAELQLLIDEYGDIPLEGSTYGTVAYAHLTAHTPGELAIGQPAPEIIGADVDGNEMRLSDFHGNVTVFYFWGDW
ncbi:MAG: peroxiredoxin family protein [Gemmatimonadetes bacterium]|nr:peroxiredoxin family protein [Gemmatimonadota bacterium]